MNLELNDWERRSLRNLLIAVCDPNYQGYKKKCGRDELESCLENNMPNYETTDGMMPDLERILDRLEQG